MTLVWVRVCWLTGNARLGDVINAKKKKIEIGCVLIIKHFLRSDEKEVKLVPSA